MASPLLVTVLVGVGLGSDPTMLAMNDAMVEALGPEAMVRFQEAAAPGSQFQSLARQDPQVAVAWVEWTDNEHRQVVLHARRDHAGGWQQRFLRFQDSDVPTERGRTLGFVLASILRPAPVLSVPKPIAQPEPAREIARRWAIEALAMGSTGISGTAGAAFALRRSLLPWLGTRVGVAGRMGNMGSAGAVWLTSRVTLGASARWLASRRLSLGSRLDSALFLETVSRSSDDDRTTRRWRFLPGAAAMVEMAYSPASATEIVLNLGAEIAFGRTSVYVEDRQVAILPMLRGVAELGLRISF
jgi:nucleotide-binding universal stress UspA family protein